MFEKFSSSKGPGLHKYIVTVIDGLKLLLLITLFSYNCNLPEQENKAMIALAMVILLAAQSESIFFTSNYFVILGDISYSIYLIHWPLICLLRMFRGNDNFNWKGMKSHKLCVVKF